MKHSDRFTHLGHLFVAVGNAELKDNIVESFVFVLLYHRESLSAGLLNSLKKQEVCVINFAPVRKCSASVRTEGVVGAATISCGSFQRNGFAVRNNDLQEHHPGLLHANDELFVLSFQVRLELNFQRFGASFYPS
jgi:hypothetical protein